MKIGFAEKIITPPVGTPMGGYGGRIEPAKGVHDDLFCSVVVFSNEKNTATIVSCDLVGVDKKSVDELKQRLLDNYSISPELVLVCATHTHSGPRNINLFGPAYKGYEKIYDDIFATISEALNVQQDCNAELYKGNIKEVGYNRREWDENSRIVDEEAIAIKVKNSDGKVIGIIYNYGCHPVVFPTENLNFSSDWPHFTRRELRKVYGQKITVLYLQGALGNVNPVNVPFDGNKIPNTSKDVEEIGVKVAEGLSKILEGSSHKLGSEILGKQEEVTLKADDPEKLEDFTWTVQREVDGEPQVVTSLQVLNLGGVKLAGVPGELFAELGRTIKGKYTDGKIMVVGFANDYIGYIPTRAAFLAGGYEAMMMGLDENEGDIIVERLGQLLKQVI